MEMRGRPATQPARIVSIVLYTAVFMVNIYYRMTDPFYQPTMLNSAILFFGITILIGMELVEQASFKEKPPLRYAVGSLAARIILIQLIGIEDNSGFYRFFFLLPPVIAYLYIGKRASYILGVLCFVLSLLALRICCGPIWWAVGDNVADSILIFVGLIFAILMARTVVMQEQSQKRTEALLEELRSSQRQVAALATVDERNRIARDIHDSVGHHLTAVNIQLEKAMAFQEINPAEAQQALKDAKRSAQSALTDVRDSVSALREEERPFELTPALHQLINGFGSLPTKLQIEGDETNIAKSTLMALYRVAQEGLTNIEKHAEATEASLKVSLQSPDATLVLEDNGLGIDLELLEQKSNSREAHFGLSGLQERLELLGGSLTIRTKQPQGTQLAARIPVRGLA
ncbi:MAG: sensor histidine kinase [Chloroflexota bacterium]